MGRDELTQGHESIRPRGPYSELLSAAVTKRTRDLMKALAAARGRSCAEEVRAAVREHLAQAGLGDE